MAARAGCRVVARADRRGVRRLRGRGGALDAPRRGRLSRRSPPRLPWLRRLRHATLRPPRVVSPHRAIPGHRAARAAGARARAAARSSRAGARRAEDALDAYRAAWRRARAAALAASSLDWLARDAPPLLVTADGGRVVWDPEAPGARRRRCGACSRTPTRSPCAPSTTTCASSTATRARSSPPSSIPRALPHAAGRRRPARLQLPPPRAPADRLRPRRAGHGAPPRPAPALRARDARRAHGARVGAPRRRGGLGAAHRGRRTVAGARRTRSPTTLDATIAAAPAAVRARTAADLARARATAAPPGARSSRIAAHAHARLPRQPPRAALPRRATSARPTSATTSARCGPTTRPTQLWRMLVRYLYEYQYLGPHLGLTRIADARTFLWQSTWFADDFFASGVLDDARFDALAEGVAALCRAHSVDETRFSGAKRMVTVSCYSALQGLPASPDLARSLGNGRTRHGCPNGIRLRRRTPRSSASRASA